MARAKRRPLAPEQWAEVRKAFEAGATEADLSRRFGPDRKTIRARRLQENWIPQVIPQHVPSNTELRNLHERAQAKVIDFTTRKAFEQIEESGVVEVVVGDTIETRRLVVQASRIASEYIVAVLTRAKDGKIKPAMSPGEQTEADVVKSMMSAYKMFASMTREVDGLRPGTPTIATDDERKPKNLTFREAQRRDDEQSQAR